MLFSEDELYYAYRKAKADLFFEKSMPCAKRFAQYEARLQKNLAKLSKKLHNTKWFKKPAFIGGVSFVPKSFDPGKFEPTEPKFLASNALDNWKRLFQQADSNRRDMKIEFRPIADFTVDMHVIAALWINCVGHKFDACLGSSALGARLRRVIGSEEYHTDVCQSFTPYFRAYQKWRDNGFLAIRKELERGRKVVALTLDLRRFFHQINGTFLIDPRFHDVLKKLNPGFELQAREKTLTRQLLSAFNAWSKRIPGKEPHAPPGLPVGCTASRVIANVALVEFDRLIETQLMPVYYARYVDDIFLVLTDNGSFSSGMDVLKFLVERMSPTIIFEPDNESSTMKLDLPYTRESKLEFQTEKQRIFLIDDYDLIDAIKANVDEVSSEWRLLPDLHQLERSAAVKALSTTKDGSTDGDALRKTDSLSLKRLSFALLLRNANALADALPSKEWKKQRYEFYDFSMRHIIAPGKLFELAEYLPKLVQIAVCCRDWHFQKKLLSNLKQILSSLRERAKLEYLGKDQTAENRKIIWDKFFQHLTNAFEEAMLTAVRPTVNSGTIKNYNLLHKQIREFNDKQEDLFPEVMRDAEQVFLSDMARWPYKSLLLRDINHIYKQRTEVPANLPAVLATRADRIEHILKEVKTKNACVMPLLFPTRPLGPEDLSWLCPNIAFDLGTLKTWLNTLRGTRYPIGNEQTMEGAAREKIGNGKRKENPRIAVTSFLTEYSSWACAAGRSPDLSANRYDRFVSLRKAILKTPKSARPSYVLLPELSVPSKWIRSFAEPLLKAGISVIAGEEYSHHGKKNKLVDNTARLLLTDNRLGYRSWVSVIQLKGKAAHPERDGLRSQFGIFLKPSKRSLTEKRIYSHFGFKFGVLICSELTDLEHRLDFRGKIDSLFVLSWNRDLDSFSSLVDSSALDIHCFVAIVNNRMYGDSRVRSPYKDNWLKDSVRVKGGLADYFVVAELDIQSLRDFQCHKEPPDGPFKPFPEGLSVSRDRKTVPGTKKSRA